METSRAAGTTTLKDATLVDPTEHGDTFVVGE
jgi:hypothetical protein